jgi:hypothetical protein
MHRYVIFLIALLACTSPVSAQHPKVLAPHKPVPPTVTPQPNWHLSKPTQRSLVGGFWMIDANFKSTLYLKNGVKNAPVTATPILYLSNGKNFTLPEVQLDPSGTAVVNINNELSKQGIASWATLSGYLEVRYSHAWDPICATLQDVDSAHSLIFTYTLRSAFPTAQLQNSAFSAAENQSLEGMWWKQENNVTGFVALSNVLAQPLSANMVVSDSQGKLVSQHTVTVSPHGTKLVKLDELQNAPSTEGGITISYQGPEGGLLINGGLEDPSNGYSATLRFYPADALQMEPPAQGYAELGLMAGFADPMMLFPARTVFTPYSLIRNPTNEPIGITPVLWWMEASTPRSVRLPRFVLPAGATENLPVKSLLERAGLSNFNGSFNLILEADTKLSGLLMSSGSVDQSNTYVFEVIPQGVGNSISKALSYWSTGRGDDTMITIWNPADEAQDFVFTLFFSGGSYKVPIPLGPRATRNFNVSEIVHSQLPDVDGNRIPSAIDEGSAEIAGLRGEAEEILVGVNAGIYNVQKATCGNPCNVCNGETNVFMQIEPFSLTVGASTTESFIEQLNTGSNLNISSGSNWSSSNTSIASVQNPGTVKGKSGGSFTAYVNSNPETFFIYNRCITVGPCPQNSLQTSGGGTVPPNPTITGVSFSPGLVLGASGVMTITGTNFSSFLGAVTVVFSQGITTSNPSLNAGTNTITANYQVTCSTLVGANSFFVSSAGGDGGAGAQTNSWPVTVTLPAAPTPTILFGGKSISGAQSVVVGQQIVLSASYSLPNCTSVASQTWNAPGTTVGNFSVVGTTGSTSPANFATSPTQFYWVDAGSSRQVTYSYTLNTGATSQQASATFNVAGPTATVTTLLGSVKIINNSLIGFDKNTDIGITFDATVTAPSGYSGSSEWGQLISNFSIAFKSPNVTLTCTLPAYGIDSFFPYSTGTLTNDSPTGGLADPHGNPNTETTVTFSAQMFLMWTPSNVTSPIPVPLGSVKWNWSGDATLNTTTKIWSVKSSSRNANSFARSPTYPTWKDVVLPNQVVCN